MIKLRVNGQVHEVNVDPETPLLWVLREQLGLTGAKYGCGIGYCGNCTIHIDNVAVQSCMVAVVDAVDKEILTIEGLAKDDQLHPIQQAWLDEGVPECGYCQSGQIMNALSLLNRSTSITDQQINDEMSNVICRCGTYGRIKKAIHRTARRLKELNHG